MKKPTANNEFVCGGEKFFGSNCFSCQLKIKTTRAISECTWTAPCPWFSKKNEITSYSWLIYCQQIVSCSWASLGGESIEQYAGYNRSKSDLSLRTREGKTTSSCCRVGLTFLEVLLLPCCMLACASICLSNKDFRDCLHSVSEKYCTVLLTCFSCLNWCKVSSQW